MGSKERKIGLSNEIIKSIKDIVKKYNYKFKIFGSRARENYKYNSDIDIAIFENVCQEDEYKIRNDFDLLEIPYMIDLVFVNSNTKKELLIQIIKEGVDL